MDFPMNRSLKDITFGQPSELEMNQEGGFEAIFSPISQPKSFDRGCLRLGDLWNKFLETLLLLQTDSTSSYHTFAGILFLFPVLEVWWGKGGREEGYGRHGFTHAHSLRKQPVRTFTAFLTYFSLFRLLLWDCDDRSYSYYVEVSTNQQQWTMVADRTKVSCK